MKRWFRIQARWISWFRVRALSCLIWAWWGFYFQLVITKVLCSAFAEAVPQFNDLRGDNVAHATNWVAYTYRNMLRKGRWLLIHCFKTQQLQPLEPSEPGRFLFQCGRCFYDAHVALTIIHQECDVWYACRSPSTQTSPQGLGEYTGRACTSAAQWAHPFESMSRH
jgi:hypothetical protein